MKMPKHIYVYQCDIIDETPVYACVDSIDEIPEDEDGSLVGKYSLDDIRQFRVVKTFGSTEE